MFFCFVLFCYSVLAYAVRRGITILWGKCFKGLMYGLVTIEAEDVCVCLRLLALDNEHVYVDDVMVCPLGRYFPGFMGG